MSGRRLIWKNLSRFRLRLFLTAFAIFIAFFLLGTLAGFNRSLNLGAELAAANRLIVSNKINFTQPLPISYVNRIRTIKGVTAASHQSWFGAYYQEPRNFLFGFAIEPDTYLEIYEDDLVLSDEEKDAFLKNRQGALVGADIAEQYGWRLGDRVPISSNIYEQADGSKTWDMIISGIYETSRAENPSNALFFHYEYLDEARTFGRDQTGTVVLTTEDPAINDQVAQAIDTRFLNSAYATETRTEAAFNRSFIEQLGNLGFIIRSVVAAAFFTILIIVGNTMALSIRERRAEIAVMKALGFTARRVFALILSEAIVLSFLGAFPGMLAAWGLAKLASSIPGFPFPLQITPTIWLQAALVMLGLGFFTGLPPAWSAYRTKIATAFTKA